MSCIDKVIDNNHFAVPGGNEGPSGVLICSENYITYKNFGDQPDIRCPIPRRRVRHIVFVHMYVTIFKLVPFMTNDSEKK